MNMRGMVKGMLALPLILAVVACSPYYTRDGYGYRQVSSVEVERAIAANPHVESHSIRVRTEGNVVYLSGELDSEHMREEAIRAAYSVPGVDRVVADDLVVERYSYR